MTPALDVLTKALNRASLDETPRGTALRLISALSAAGYSISQTRRTSSEGRTDVGMDESS